MDLIEQRTPHNAYRLTVSGNGWLSVYAGEITIGAIAQDPRRFTARQGDDLVLHRRSMIDGHVVGAVCGDLFTHAGVLELAPGS